MARRYGQRAGNPRGAKEDTAYCIAEVWSDMRAYQCGRKRGHGPSEFYCKQHAKMVANGRAVLTGGA